jgi:hypothetical protein
LLGGPPALTLLVKELSWLARAVSDTRLVLGDAAVDA